MLHNHMVFFDVEAANVVVFDEVKHELALGPDASAMLALPMEHVSEDAVLIGIRVHQWFTTRSAFEDVGTEIALTGYESDSVLPKFLPVMWAESSAVGVARSFGISWGLPEIFRTSLRTSCMRCT